MKRSRSRLGWTTTYIDFFKVFRFTFPVPVTGPRAKLAPALSLALPPKLLKISSSSFSLEKNFELDLWASLYDIQNTVVFCHPKP